MKKEEVIHIAKLAKLKLSDEQADKMTHELSSILDHVSMMEKVDTSSVKETSQVTGQTNAMQSDVVEVNGNETALLNCSKHPKENHSIRINKMM